MVFSMLDANELVNLGVVAVKDSDEKLPKTNIVTCQGNKQS